MFTAYRRIGENRYQERTASISKTSHPASASGIVQASPFRSRTTRTRPSIR